jgi:hypothetical protein
VIEREEEKRKGTMSGEKIRGESKDPFRTMEERRRDPPSLTTTACEINDIGGEGENVE